MSDVRAEVRDGLGHITLDRPRAINALSHDMVRAVAAALDAWEHDDAVRAVLIDGAGERGLCAGGDIRMFYADARTGGTASLSFWADEYRLNARVGSYPKPYVALMDGLVLGGGVGVSAHGSVRVVTERSRIGMPEVGIGFVPDVGGTYLLSRLPGQLGLHAALTTAQLSGADAVHCGLADHYVPSARLGALVDALRAALGSCAAPPSRPSPAAPAAAASGLGPGSTAALVTDVIGTFAEPVPASDLRAQADWIDDCYAAPTVEEILSRLTERGEAAVSAAKEIGTKSPTSLKVTLRALRSAAALPTLEAALDQEFRMVNVCLRAPDLAEGIRAQIIDKDRSPRWSPSVLEDVDEALVASFFAPLGRDELGLAAAAPA
jgi:enoyl-CoA hydratase